jgi:hypothetical protein
VTQPRMSSFVNSWDGNERRFDPPKTIPARDVAVYIRPYIAKARKKPTMF